MNKECVPFNGSFASLGEAVGRQKRPQLKPHPNIVDIKGIFAGMVPWLPDALELYPNALPSRINEHGYGRNMTLFLVMKRYDTSLKDYLAKEKPKQQTSLILLTQLLEAVSHLVRNKIAHRDLKSDNILLDLSHGTSFPWLVVTDFGCCVNPLRIPLTSDEVSRGGNGALMAPEIICAEPGPYSSLDYSASDLWSSGAIAHEIFGGFNPFYPYKERREYLISAHYEESHLPEAPSSMPKALKLMVASILQRDPSKRPTPKVAANLCHMLLHASNRSVTILREASILPEVVASSKLLQWLQSLSAATLCQRKTTMNGKRLNPVELKLRLLFLSQVKLDHLLGALLYLNPVADPEL
jgi:PTEN induced putative kinase 1